MRITMTSLMGKTQAHTLHFVFALLYLYGCAPALTQTESLIREAQWTARDVAPGVVWRYQHFDSLFEARQSITVLDIDLDKVHARVEHVDSGFFKTSARAEEAGAIAAINGSFFDTRRGGSVVFLQHDGEIVTPPNDAPRAYRDNAGLAVDATGDVDIIRKPKGGWKMQSNYATVLSSGPLLVFDGDTVAQVQQKFNTNRHPRTALGLTTNNHLVAVVVDGRSSEAYGMSTPELAQLMKALGCTIAMNLDGGGSSTAWIKGVGVVNNPSDNKKFDHDGERAVSNCIVFVPITASQRWRRR